jgi:hypothetical protein
VLKYFQGFEKLNYTLDNEELSLMNIFNRPYINYSFDPSYINDSTTFIEDGVSPDKVSYMMYQTHDYFWIILLQNKIIDYYKEWPTAYQVWKDELYSVYSEETFYDKYYKTALTASKGDLVVKRMNSGALDSSNYGVIVDTNLYLRSFDVTMLSGKIEEGDSYYILKKDGKYYNYIDPTSDTLIKPLNELENPLVLLRKDKKLDSVSDFYGYFTYNGAKMFVSPYNDVTNITSTLISFSTDDISDYPNTLLYRYMTRNLPSNYFSRSFVDKLESEWIFRKNIKTINQKHLREVKKQYLNFVYGTE